MNDFTEFGYRQALGDAVPRYSQDGWGRPPQSSEAVATGRVIHDPTEDELAVLAVMGISADVPQAYQAYPGSGDIDAIERYSRHNGVAHYRSEAVGDPEEVERFRRGLSTTARASLESAPAYPALPAVRPLAPAAHEYIDDGYYKPTIRQHIAARMAESLRHQGGTIKKGLGKTALVGAVFCVSVGALGSIIEGEGSNPLAYAENSLKPLGLLAAPINPLVHLVERAL